MKAAPQDPEGTPAMRCKRLARRPGKEVTLIRMLACALALSTSLIGAPPAGAEPFPQAAQFLERYCVSCHQGESPAGGLNLDRLRTSAALKNDLGQWRRIVLRVRNGEMPPKGVRAPAPEEREAFTGWVQNQLHAEACASGIVPGPSPIRRLNRSEYSATIRDLLDIHLNIGSVLPAEGAGGEGFDNAAETLFLSPVHAEKYLDAAKLALTAAARDAKARARIFIAKPGNGVSQQEAARRILSAFLPKAFRRPLREVDVEKYAALARTAQKRGASFDDSILLALRAALVSPQFLFRYERPNPEPQPRRVDDYALASRLSYFLWGSMPDSLLFDLAEQGKLHEPEILKWQVGRMLRSIKSLEFETRFIEQWLGTRELGSSINPDAKLFPAYADDELRSDIRYQPVLFFRELLTSNESLLNLLDSKFTIVTRKLQKLYGLNVKPPRPNAQEQPQRIELPADSHRGGLLGMSAVLIASSYPHRTSPVLRGKWLLETLLGTPPPPPPPNVPPLEEHAGAAPQTVRERLAQHRANPACASCHNRIDPLGFALENYDAIGRWRTEDSGKPIDNTGEMPDGTKFEGPEGLKAMLLQHKALVMRHLTSKMLGYALGRGLTLEDSCVVDQIMTDLKRTNYSAQSLVENIVFSMPFQYQAASPPRVTHLKPRGRLPRTTGGE